MQKICASKERSCLCTKVYVAHKTAFKKSVAIENVACAGFHIFIQVVFDRMAVEMLQFLIVDVSFVAA